MKNFVTAMVIMLMSVVLSAAEYDPKETIGAGAFVKKCDVPVKKHKKEVSTYLIGAYVDVQMAATKLVKAGFEVLARYPSHEHGTTLVFTNAMMKAQANKPGRGFAAVLRLYVDEKRKRISITNPKYFFKAFLQDEYSQNNADAVLTALNCEFVDLKESTDEWLFSALPQYQFMMGMAHYQDMLSLAKGENSDLVEKARNYQHGRDVIFELKLDDNRYLLGYELAEKTKAFLDKTGTQNGAILPYTVLIEEGTAKALDAKYYIALSYPLLDLSRFATILATPRAIKKDLRKPFK